MSDTRNVTVYKVRAEDFQGRPETPDNLSREQELRADFDLLPKHERDALCRDLVAAIKERFKDPAVQEDFEKWKAERAARA